MKYLYVNGDSYTYGMDDNNFGVPILNRWSTLVAKEFDLQEVNDSENGSSNQEIVDRTLNWFENNKDKWDDILVLIGWSISVRQNKSWKDNEKLYANSDYYKFSYEMKNHILLLQSFFKSNNISYNFHIAFGENPRDYINDKLVDEKHFCDISFMDFIKIKEPNFFIKSFFKIWNNKETPGFYRHPGEREHQIWSVYLGDRIKDGKL
jgi:hypothetical protein